ncbi:type VI secretion system baseplate subunit TssG [Sedimentisphaera salicampi]|uniref:Type VI secretion protein, family n=1 Tax=Sedimentisphaera salicampi TaxID=1941349 RepID=A0A1W6LMB2_9BACT|nr:type VI secretion system baseplate subunit TssG [Sedimentisphaera salicampi]ARN56928.1 type VI secretion protein, family [Sedimentisphaera salicampi]
MCGRERTEKSYIRPEWRKQPYNYDFCQIVRSLEAGSAYSVGSSTQPKEDVCRFGQKISLGFAPSNLDSIKQENGLIPELRVNFMGLLGPNGPMPFHITEKVLDLNRRGERGFEAFLNLFNNRMTALFYRAWTLPLPAVSYGLSDRSFDYYISSIAGFGGSSLKNRDEVKDNFKGYFAASFSCQVKNSEGLKSAVEEYFRCPVRVVEFKGDWFEISDSEKFIMGSGASSVLGSSSIVGRQVWNCQNGIEMALGPLGLDSYESFLPAGRLHQTLLDLIKNYCGDEFQIDLRLILKREEIEPLQMGCFGRLGYTSWLLSQGDLSNADNQIVLRKVV